MKLLKSNKVRFPKVKKLKNSWKTKYDKRVKQVKQRVEPMLDPVNRQYRNFRALELKHDRLVQQRLTVPDVVDDTQRTCFNCGHRYTGRVCPQCGQVGTWERYSWRQAVLNFLDIWGLGNRPMFRTLRELFQRPGYMVQDYLKGHRQFYFPPFKLLAVTVVFTLAISWLIGVELGTTFGRINEYIQSNDSFQHGLMHTVVSKSQQTLKYLAGQPLYDRLIIAVVAVLCV